MLRSSFDRGPSKLLAASNGSLRLLPFDRGPCLLLTALRIITRLFFQLSEVMEPAHLRTPYSPAKTQQVSFRMMILLSILLLDIPLTGIYLFDICTSTSSVMDHELMGSDRNYTALRTYVQWSVRLSTLLTTIYRLLEEGSHCKDSDSLVTSPLCTARLLLSQLKIK